MIQHSEIKDLETEWSLREDVIEKDYRKDNGDRIQRTVEPYSLRRTVDENIILHAFDRYRNSNRSFRVDRLMAVSVTQTPFTPKYKVEFTQAGKLNAEINMKSESPI